MDATHTITPYVLYDIQETHSSLTKEVTSMDTHEPFASCLVSSKITTCKVYKVQNSADRTLTGAKK